MISDLAQLCRGRRGKLELVVKMPRRPALHLQHLGGATGPPCAWRSRSRGAAVAVLPRRDPWPDVEPSCAGYSRCVELVRNYGRCAGRSSVCRCGDWTDGHGEGLIARLEQPARESPARHGY